MERGAYGEGKQNVIECNRAKLMDFSWVTSD